MVKKFLYLFFFISIILSSYIHAQNDPYRAYISFSVNSFSDQTVHLRKDFFNYLKSSTYSSNSIHKEPKLDSKIAKAITGISTQPDIIDSRIQHQITYEYPTHATEYKKAVQTILHEVKIQQRFNPPSEIRKIVFYSLKTLFYSSVCHY